MADLQFFFFFFLIWEDITCTNGALVIIQENPEGLITIACKYYHVVYTDGH